MKKFQVAHCGQLSIRSRVYHGIWCCKESCVAKEVHHQAWSGTLHRLSSSTLLQQYWSYSSDKGVEGTLTDEAYFASLPSYPRYRGSRWYQPSEDRWKKNLADPFTKALMVKEFEDHKIKMYRLALVQVGVVRKYILKLIISLLTIMLFDIIV